MEGHDDEAQELGRAQAGRHNWSNEESQHLLEAVLNWEKENGRLPRRKDKWETISRSVFNMHALQCRRRMETLRKSFKDINDHCAAKLKQYNELTEEDFRSLKLATKMEPNLYYLMCEINEQRKNAMGASAPATVMAGPQGDMIGEVVGTPKPAWPARDPPRSTSPTALQCHCGAGPGFPALADPPSHPQHYVNHVEAWIGTQANTSEPLLSPLDDLESSHIFEGLEDLQIASYMKLLISNTFGVPDMISGHGRLF